MWNLECGIDVTLRVNIALRLRLRFKATPPQADGRSVYNKYRSRLAKYPYECRVSGAPACRRCQFAPVAPLRSALHSYRTFTTRGRYFFGISGIVLFPAAFIQIAAYKAFLRVQSERSERLRELPSAGTHWGIYKYLTERTANIMLQKSENRAAGTVQPVFFIPAEP